MIATILNHFIVLVDNFKHESNNTFGGAESGLVYLAWSNAKLKKIMLN